MTLLEGPISPSSCALLNWFDGYNDVNILCLDDNGPEIDELDFAIFLTTTMEPWRGDEEEEEQEDKEKSSRRRRRADSTPGTSPRWTLEEAAAAVAGDTMNSLPSSPSYPSLGIQTLPTIYTARSKEDEDFMALASALAADDADMDKKPAAQDDKDDDRKPAARQEEAKEQRQQQQQDDNRRDVVLKM